MRVEDLDQTLDSADLIPPIMLLQNGEHSSQNVSDVAAPSNIAGERSVFDNHHDSASVIENDDSVLDWFDLSFDISDAHSNKLRNLLPCFFNIFALVDIKLTAVWRELLPDSFIEIQVQHFFDYEFKRLSECVHIRSRSPIHNPAHSFLSNARINHPNWKLLSRPVRECLVLHEHAIPNFQSSHEEFHTRSQIATPCPDILTPCDFNGRDFEIFSQPFLHTSHTVVFPEEILLSIIESVNSHHNET